MQYKPRHDWGRANKYAHQGTATRPSYAGRAPSGSLLSAWVYDFDKGQLDVWYKGKDGKAGATYRYYFSEPTEGELIVEEMNDSPHPWTQVLMPKVVLAKVPYTRL